MCNDHSKLDVVGAVHVDVTVAVDVDVCVGAIVHQVIEHDMKYIVTHYMKSTIIQCDHCNKYITFARVPHTTV